MQNLININTSTRQDAANSNFRLNKGFYKENQSVMNKDSLHSKLANPYSHYTSYKDSYQESKLMKTVENYKVEVKEPKIVPAKQIG